MSPRRAQPDFTQLEAEVLYMAASTIRDDLAQEGGDLMGWTRAETAAYFRGLDKLRAARWGKPEVVR